MLGFIDGSATDTDGHGTMLTGSPTLCETTALAVPPRRRASIAALWRRSSTWDALTAPAWLTHPVFMPLALFAAVLLVQLVVGAFQSERGLYSDEASHLMNGLLLRDYLRDGIGQNPLAFARDYYDHYPKVAPFMWPPLFHTVLGITLLPGWSPTAGALVLLGLCTAWTAWRLYTMVLSFSSVPVALGTVALFLATPAVISLTSSVMVDIVIAMFALEAAYWLGRFAHSGATRDAVLFGLMAALGCMSKGNGLSAIVAPLILIATGYHRLLRKPGLYAAALLVVVLAAPPLMVAWKFDATLGDFGPLTPALILERWSFFSDQVWRQLGTGPLLFSLVGIGALVVRPVWMTSAIRGVAAGLFAMAAGAFVFHLLSPHLISAARYITLALAPLLALAAFGVTAVTFAVPSRPWRWSLQLGIFAALIVAHGLSHPRVSAQAPLGYRSVMNDLNQRHELAGRRVLIVSNEQGEGAGVSEAAVLHPVPMATIVRGSKVLASDDWMGRDFRLRYDSADAMLAALEAMHMDYLVLDRSAAAQSVGYWPQVEQLVTTHGDRLEMVSEVPADPVRGPLRPLAVYKLKYQSSQPAARPVVSAGSTLVAGLIRK